jgi:hypothetical protein
LGYTAEPSSSMNRTFVLYWSHRLSTIHYQDSLEGASDETPI